MPDTFIPISGLAKLQAGNTSRVFATDSLSNIQFTISSASPFLVRLEAAVGSGGSSAYSPADTDFVPHSNYSSSGLYSAVMLGTVMRFRVVSGSDVEIRLLQRTSTLVNQSANSIGSPATDYSVQIADLNTKVSTLKATVNIAHESDIQAYLAALEASYVSQGNPGASVGTRIAAQDTFRRFIVGSKKTDGTYNLIRDDSGKLDAAAFGVIDDVQMLDTASTTAGATRLPYRARHSPLLTW